MSINVEKTARRRWGRASEGALCGAAAGLLAVALELLARATIGLPSPAELMGDQGTRLIPGPLFEFLLDTFGHSTRYLYLIGLLAAQIIGLTLLTAFAFAARAAFIKRRGLRVAAEDEPDAADETGNKAASDAAQESVNDLTEPAAADHEEDEWRSLDEQPDHSPARRAALLAAAPMIQAPVSWLFSAVLAAIAWTLSGLLVLPALGAGLFGADLPVGPETVLVSLLVPALAFGASLPALQRCLRLLTLRLVGSPMLQKTFSPGRRLFLKRLSMSLVVLGVGSLAWRFITQGISNGQAAGADSLDGPPPPERISPPPTPDYRTWQPVHGETPELTATNDFYYVSKNIYSDPSLDKDSWRLNVDGEGVIHPFSLSYQDLLSMPAVEQITTLECISNTVGGNLMSSARWKGIRLRDILEKAGVKTGSTKVAFHAADGYTDSIHLSKAVDPLTLLVYQINGQPLPQAHGFPARMIVPGIYGMKHCKWITEIEVVNYDFQGYWQQRGWNDDGIINLGARIDVPYDGASLAVNRQTYLAGVAFAGTRGVSAVDVSTNNGRTWQRARLKQPLGTVTWTLWELPWTPPSSDTYAIVARMIDLQGYYQQPVLADPFPSGATGYHRIYVDVN